MARASQDRPLEKLGKYRIVRLLGQGGMGAVYRAVDEESGQEVALKILGGDAANQPRRLERFRREAQHGARLRHENIVALYEFGEHRGTYFLAMEYVEGIDLEQYIKQSGAVTPADARQILVQVTKALDHAHQAGLVHRDIKPANILLTQRHGRLVVKVADLGLARLASDEESRVTSDGCTVGTVDYMAPEQARDSHSADIRSDLYSLGCTLYHLLSGAPPFATGSILERVMKHAKAEPPDLREADPAIPPDLWAACRRLLAKKPGQRYQSPAELLVDLLTTGDAEAKSQAAHKLKLPKKTVAVFGSDRPTPGDEAPAAATTDERVAAGQYETAVRAIETSSYDYALPLLLNCCRLDPGNVAFRKALHQAQAERASQPDGKPWHCGAVRVAYKLAVQAAHRMQKPRLVLRWGAEALAADPHDADTALAMVAAADALDHRDLAIYLAEDVLSYDGANVAARRALAGLAEGQGDLPRALALWEEVAKADPNDYEARAKARDLSVSKTYLWNNQGARASRPRDPSTPRRRLPK